MIVYYVVNRSIHRHLFCAYLRHSTLVLSSKPKPIYMTSRSWLKRLIQDAYFVYCCLKVSFLRNTALVLPHTSTTICASRLFQVLYSVPLRLLVSRNKLIIVDDGFLVVSPHVYQALLSPGLQRFDLVTLSLNASCRDLSHISRQGANVIPVSIDHEAFSGVDCHPMLSRMAEEPPVPVNVIIGSRFLDEEKLCHLVDPHSRNLYINHPDPAKTVSKETFHYLSLQTIDSAGDLESLLYSFSLTSSVPLSFYVGLTSTTFFIYTMIQAFSLNWNVCMVIDSSPNNSYYIKLVEDYGTCLSKLSARFS